MAIKTRTRILDESIPFKKDGLTFIKIPRDNPLRRISCVLKVKFADGGVDAVGAIQDGLLKLVKEMRLVRNGSDNKIDVDLKSYFYASAMQLGVQPSRDVIPDPATFVNFFKVAFTFDFAKFKNDLGDLNHLLNAPDLESLNLKIQWGSIADIFTTPNVTTIDATTSIKVSIIEVYDDQGKKEELANLLGNAIDYLEAVETFDVTKVNDSFPGSQQTEKIQPVPHIHEITTFITSLNDETRSDDVIDILKVANVTSGGETILIENWDDYRARIKSDFALDTNIVGVLPIDWDTLRRGGLRVIEDDAIKWFFQTAAPVGGSAAPTKIRIYKKTYAVGV